MSADNWIYIAKFNDGYRVIHTQNIENLSYHPIGTKEREEELDDYYGWETAYKTKEEAYVRAMKMEEQWNKDEEEFGIWCSIEYWISYLWEFDYTPKPPQRWIEN